MYTFRALSDLDAKSYINSGCLECKNRNNVKTLRDALSQLNSHLMKGSTNNYCWISTSNDFFVDIENYCLPNSTFSNNRKEVAILMGLDETKIIFDDGIRALNVYTNSRANIINNHAVILRSTATYLDSDIKHFPYVVLDLSDKKSKNRLRDRGLLVDTKGKVIDSYCRGYSYAENSRELVVYGQIDKKNIRYILNPLEVDILYVLGASNNFSLKAYEIDYTIENIFNELDVDDCLTELEAFFYKEFYIENKNLSTIAYEILLQNTINCQIKINEESGGITITSFDSSIDILNIFAYLKRMKRRIISKIISKNASNFKIDENDVVIPEDKMNILRIGHVNQDGVVRVYHKNVPIYIPQQNYDITNSQRTYDNLKDVEYAVMYGNTDICDENIRWFDECITKKTYDGMLTDDKIKEKVRNLIK